MFVNSCAVRFASSEESLSSRAFFRIESSLEGAAAVSDVCQVVPRLQGDRPLTPLIREHDPCAYDERVDSVARSVLTLP